MDLSDLMGGAAAVFPDRPFQVFQALYRDQAAQIDVQFLNEMARVVNKRIDDGYTSIPMSMR